MARKQKQPTRREMEQQYQDELYDLVETGLYATLRGEWRRHPFVMNRMMDVSVESYSNQSEFIQRMVHWDYDGS